VTHWYERSFGSDYLALYPHRDLAEAREDVAAIGDLIAPSRDEPLLDLCCGAGRHLLALHEAGYTDLTGVDLSSVLLDAARAGLRAGGADDVRLVRADMRRIPFRDRFQTILSLFTSFGYFDLEDDNLETLRSAYRALRPGGTFVLDTLNRPWTIAHLAPRAETMIEGRLARITRSISPDGRRIEKTVELTPGGEVPRSYRESVRMYSADELRTLLDRAGFAGVRLYGGLDGRPHDADQPRMVAIGRRSSRGEVS